ELQRSRRAWGVMLLCGLAACEGRSAEQEPPPEGAQVTEAAPQWEDHVGLGARANYRRSDENRFAVPFPFKPQELPPGQTKGFEETVDAGTHEEISDVT